MFVPPMTPSTFVGFTDFTPLIFLTFDQKSLLFQFQTLSPNLFARITSLSLFTYLRALWYLALVFLRMSAIQLVLRQPFFSITNAKI